MENKETIAQEALRLLKEVPEDQWITDQYTDKIGKCCSLGHYARLKKGYKSYDMWNNYYEDSYTLREKTQEFLAKKYNLNNEEDLSTVNNEPTVNGYTQESIKERVITCLSEMVAEGF